jgi:hypothetical protein
VASESLSKPGIQKDYQQNPAEPWGFLYALILNNPGIVKNSGASGHNLDIVTYTIVSIE